MNLTIYPKHKNQVLVFGCNITAHNITTASMPRTSERTQALQDIDAAIEVAAYAYLLGSDEVEEEEVEELEEIEEHIQDLLAVRDIIATPQYLSRDVGAGRHEIDILEAYIYQYPGGAFLALFRLHRVSLWQLVGILTQAGRRGYWDHRAIESGRSPKPI